MFDDDIQAWRFLIVIDQLLADERKGISFGNGFQKNDHWIWINLLLKSVKWDRIATALVLIFNPHNTPSTKWNTKRYEEL